MKHDKEALKNNIRDILKNIASNFNSQTNIDKGKFIKIFTGEDQDTTQDKN